MGIEAIYRRPNMSKPAPGYKIFPYLLLCYRYLAQIVKSSLRPSERRWFNAEKLQSSPELAWAP